MFPWPAFISYIIITTSTPGPNTISSMSNGSKVGFIKTIPYTLGIFTAFSLIMMACAVFTAGLFRLMPTIKTPMLFIGAAYIFWLAYKLLRSDAAIDSGSSSSASFGSGFLLQLVNPKIYIYGITALSGFILPHYDSLPIILGFCVLLAFTGFVFCLLWAGFGSLFRTVFAKHARILNAVMAGLLVYSGIALFF